MGGKKDINAHFSYPFEGDGGAELMVVDEEAVAKALHDQKLGAYCADVMGQEPPSNENPLFKEPNAPSGRLPLLGNEFQERP